MTSVGPVSEDGDAGPEPFTRQLARWSEALAAIARTGLGFTESLYERERFEEVLHVAADMKVAVNQVLGSTARQQDHLVQEWLESVGVGVPGYVTPKVAIGAIVGNDAGELLLVQRADSKIWLYPTGWADVGYSPAEVAVKEVLEETGIQAEARRLVGVIDGQRMGFSRFGMYMLLFHLQAVGGELQCHPLECADVGWFARDDLPEKTAGLQWWKDMAFNAIDGKPFDTVFDDVRSPIWRQ